jgi:hypothetical protein
MKRTLGIAFLMAFSGPVATTAAQDPPSSDEVNVSTRPQLGAGAGYGGPLGAAASLELLYGLRADVRDDEERVKARAGVILQLHAGSGGGKVSLGVGAGARVRSDDFKGTFGAGLKLSLARTWGSPVGTATGLYYLGPELDLSAMHVAVSVGTLWRVDGAGGKGVLFTWSIGVRL